MFVSAPLKSIFVTLTLYLLQGVVLGLSDTFQLFIWKISKEWKLQTIYGLVFYPFSFKLLWAPIIDVFYFQRLGRRQTWLLPIQVILGISLIVLSFYIESLITNLNIVSLTIAMFLIVFLIATQDVCVDGWAITLFSTTNIIWQSTSQTIGQTFGRFLGAQFFLTFESANSTNRLIRRPLSLRTQDTGLFTISAFVRFWGIAFLVVTFFIAIVFRERVSKNVDQEKKLKFIQTYLSIIKILKKKCMLQLAFILIVSPFGYAATYYLTRNALIVAGMSADTYGLVTMPIILVKIIVPLILNRTNRPLTWFARLYIPRLGISVAIGIYVYYAPNLIKYPYIFYPILIGLFVINEAIIYLQLVARVGFYAQISEPRIGGTYMTLVSTLGNIGQSASSSAATAVADWLPKNYSYIIEVIACTVIGIVWLAGSWRLMHRLQTLPIGKWYTKKDKPLAVEPKTEESSDTVPNTINDAPPDVN